MFRIGHLILVIGFGASLLQLSMMISSTTATTAAAAAFGCCVRAKLAQACCWADLSKLRGGHFWLCAARPGQQSSR